MTLEEAKTIANAAFTLRSRGLGATIVLTSTSTLATRFTRGVHSADEPLTTAALVSTLESAIGAAVVFGDRIIATEALLPFDPSLLLGPEYGSRHACARTLAARFDDTVLVVSEERQNFVLFRGTKSVTLLTEDALVDALIAATNTAASEREL